MNIERLRFAHSYHWTVLQHIEAKNGVIVALSAGLMTVNDLKTVWSTISLVAFVFCATVAIISFFPADVKSKKSKPSLLFFNDVLKFENQQEGAEEFFAGEIQDYIDQLAELSFIVIRKVTCFRIATYAFLVGVVLMAIRLGVAGS